MKDETWKKKRMKLLEEIKAHRNGTPFKPHIEKEMRKPTPKTIHFKSGDRVACSHSGWLINLTVTTNLSEANCKTCIAMVKMGHV